jgi:ribose 5-phosphate isomerase B
LKCEPNTDHNWGRSGSTAFNTSAEVYSMTDEEKIRDMVRRVVCRTLGIQQRPASRSAARGTILVTEQQLQDISRGGRLAVPDGALVTPLARQAALEKNISLVEGDDRENRDPRSTSSSDETALTRKIAIGADHGGFELKETLKAHLQERGHEVVDCGTDSAQSVDYPDFAFAVAQQVAQGHAWRGIIVDGAGIGSCMAANKVPGVRAAMCYDQATAVNSREHNDANVLTLGAGMIGASLARSIVTAWLDTPTGGGRHARRVDKIMDIERRFFKEE